MKTIIEKELSFAINGACFKIHNQLGRFLTEKQYCDALEAELDMNSISFEREPSVEVLYGNRSLLVGRPDFVIEDRIVLDAKAKKFITKDDYSQMMKYLKLMKKELGMIVNFRASYLKPKRVLNSDYKDSGHSDADSDHSGRSSAGQSLIETIMAIFVLTTGLLAGLSLALFSFGSASDTAERISATSLSREGVEVVRRMRDSNWMSGALISCPDLGAGEYCYPTWLTARYDITGSAAGRHYRMIFDPASPGNKWTLGSGSNYRLYLQSGGGLSHTVTANPSNFFRKITIIYQSVAAPYSAASPEVLVRSAVWWHGKGCSAITNLTDPDQTDCKIITEEILTNWRNY